MTNEPSANDSALAAIDGRSEMMFNANRAGILATRSSEDQDALKRNESAADRDRRHADWKRSDEQALNAVKKRGRDAYEAARREHGEGMAAQIATMNAVGLPLEPERRFAIIADRLENADAAGKQLTGNGQHVAIMDGTMQTGVAQARPEITDFEHSDAVRRLGPSLARAVTFFPAQAVAEQESRISGTDSRAETVQPDPASGQTVVGRDRPQSAPAAQQSDWMGQKHEHAPYSRITASADDQKRLLQETKRRQGWGPQASSMAFPGPFDNSKPAA